MTVTRTTDGPLLRAIAAADTSRRVQYHRDPATRTFSHVARLTDGMWACDCGTVWDAELGEKHPW